MLFFFGPTRFPGLTKQSRLCLRCVKNFRHGVASSLADKPGIPEFLETRVLWGEGPRVLSPLGACNSEALLSGGRPLSTDHR